MVEYEHVRAIVRLRPPHARNAHGKGKTHKTPEGIVATVQGDAAITVQVSPTTHQIFNCDCALGPEDDQAATFERSGVQHLLEQAMQGYRCTVFAYGTTGTGKTHTIVGGEDGESEGLLPRSVDYLFERFGQIETHNFRVKLSCLEIYKEMVTDMLVPARDRTPLTVREHAEYGFFVEGLRIRLCADKAVLMDAADAALRSRKVGSHSLNARSNRSHLMLTVFIEARPRSPGRGAATYGSICFVDLAGSERLKETGSTGVMLAEAQAINKSLYVLAKVIRGLNAGRPADYRESKLTKLLWASLGGNCKTLMIACASPSASGVAETLRTLKFAIGVKGITNHPTVVLNPQNQIIKELQKEIVRLRMENARLRESLDTAGSDSGAASHTTRTASKEMTTAPARGRDSKRKNGCRKSRGGRGQEYVGSEGERKGSAGTAQAVVAAAQRGHRHGGARAPESQCAERDQQPGGFTTINQGIVAAESGSLPCQRSSAGGHQSRQVDTDGIPAATSQPTRQRAAAPTNSPADFLGADCSSEQSEYSDGCTVSTSVIWGSNPAAADDAASEPNSSCEQRLEVQEAQVGQKTSEPLGSGRPTIEVTVAQPPSARAAVGMPSSPKAALMETSLPLPRDGDESTHRKRRSSLSDIIESTRDEAVRTASPSVQTASKQYTRAGVTFIPIANERQFDLPEGSGFQLEFTLKPLTPDSRGSDGRGTDTPGNGRLHSEDMSCGDGDESVERERGGGSRGQRRDDDCSLTSDATVASVYQRQYQELAGRILMHQQQQQQQQYRSNRHPEPRLKQQELDDDSTYRVGELCIDPVDRRMHEKAKIVERSARKVANGRVLPHLRPFEDYRGEKEAVRRLVSEWERQPRGLGKSTDRSFFF